MLEQATEEAAERGQLWPWWRRGGEGGGARARSTAVVHGYGAPVRPYCAAAGRWVTRGQGRGRGQGGGRVEDKEKSEDDCKREEEGRGKEHTRPNV